jgi:phospholipase C
MAQVSAVSQIEHIVVLRLENRSFDHMLGTMVGVEGVLDAGGNVRDDLFNLADRRASRLAHGMHHPQSV